jgi:hypothetical protein
MIREPRNPYDKISKMSTQKLTPQSLKTFKGLENITDEQAAYLHEQLNQYASILLHAFPFEKIKGEINEEKNSPCNPPQTI